MFRSVEILEAFIGFDDGLWRCEWSVWWVQRPETGAEELVGRVHSLLSVETERLILLFLEGIVQIFRGLHVLEHSLQLVGILETAGLFELRDHIRLSIVRDGKCLYKTSRQIFGVEFQEHVLVVDVLEDGHLQFSSQHQKAKHDRVTYNLG